MQSHGLTFSLTDVNLDNFNLNLVPIINNPKPEKEIERVIENENILFYNTKETAVLESDIKDTNSEQLNQISDSYNVDRNAYEPVLCYWFYCEITNGLAEWKPFSIKDSNRIEHRYLQTQNYECYNNYSSLETDDYYVPSEGGRYDVYLKKRQKVSIYWEEPPMEIRRASWFYRPEDESFYLPYSESACDLLEDQYKKCLAQNLWHQSFQLTNNDFGNTNSMDMCIDSKFVFHSPNTMAEYRRYLSTSENITKGRVVYRSIESFRHHLSSGEDDDIDHVIFVIPGIGSVCDMGGRGIIECVSSMRSISATLMKSHFQSYRHGSGRVELLPVSWHNQFHKLGASDSQTSGIDKDLGRISLKSVPKLRQFTNNALIDVLCYSSTAYRQSILSIVAAEMNRLRHLFVSRNPQYEGDISIAGHSLGSMIAFDLVALQGDQIIDPGSNTTDISTPSLEFEVGHIFALGSPISLLLTARGLPTLGPDFRLNQCKGGFFNIFHPFDPVAYRVEPMLDSHWQARPVVLPHHKGRKRLHLELKDNLVRVSNDIKTKLVHTLKNTWNSLQEFATAHKTNLNDEFGEDEMVHVLNKIDVTNANGERDDYYITGNSICHGSHDDDKFIGQLNGGRRVDYVLQEAPLESFNDYLFALGSHACYWDSEDTILMMLKEIYQTRDIFPSDVHSVALASQINSSISNIPKPVQSPSLSLVSPRSQVKTNILLPPTFPSVQKSIFVPNFSPERLDDKEFSHNVIENKKPASDNGNSSGSEYFPNSHDNNWKQPENVNFDFPHQRHVMSSDISTSFVKEPTSFEEINIHEGHQINVSSEPFIGTDISQCEINAKINESSNVCPPKIGYFNPSANDHQWINENRVPKITDQWLYSKPNVEENSQYVNTKEKIDFVNPLPFKFTNFGSREFFQPNYFSEHQETSIDSSDDISSRIDSKVYQFSEFNMMTKHSMQDDQGSHVPQINVTYQQKPNYTVSSDETHNEIVTEAFDTINLIDAVDNESASSNMQYPPPPLMPFSLDSSSLLFQADAPKWPSHQIKQPKEFNCSPMSISNQPIKTFQPSMPSESIGQSYLTQSTEPILVESPGLNLPCQSTMPPNNLCQSEIHSSEAEPYGEFNDKNFHIGPPPPISFLQSDSTDSSKYLYSRNSRDLGKPFMESKPENFNYPPPILNNQLKTFNIDPPPPISFLQSDSTDSSKYLYSRNSGDLGKPFMESKPVNFNYPPSILNNQLKNVFQPTVAWDDNFSGSNDNFPNNSFQINSNIQFQSMPSSSTEAVISSLINSPSPLASMFSQSLTSDFDTLSKKELQESQCTNSSDVCQEVNPGLCYLASNDLQRKPEVTKELQNDTCRTPPRIFSPNMRQSPKPNPLVSAVFNSRPLVPQSGKLFKKK